MKNCMAIVLAGGKGARLDPLTRDCAKPAVPFGGGYRIIDFTLSNCLNSGLRRILILTQYKSTSLNRHINLGWRDYFCRGLGEFIDVAPPEQRIDESWYRGTADAVYQNIFSIEEARPEQLLILAGDHVYKMNYAGMVEFHRQRRADLTIGSMSMHKRDARQFGVMETDNDDRVIGFEEKPGRPRTLPGDDHRCLVSMGIYVFNTRFLFDTLCTDAGDEESCHDFGRDVIPAMIGGRHSVFAFRFHDERRPGAYWRDVGTLDAYYDANMDLIADDPQLNLYDSTWPIRSYQPNLPPPKFTFDTISESQRQGIAIDSTVCPGSIVSGAIRRSIIGHQVRIEKNAKVDSSILFDRVRVGRGAVVRRAIIEAGVEVMADDRIGVDVQADSARGFHITENGIAVVSRASQAVESFVSQ